MSKDEIKHLYTEAGEGLQGVPWNIYPRPQLKRDSFVCLNGIWKLSAEKVGLDGVDVTVPFAPESLLSGVNKSMGKRAELRYERPFEITFDRTRNRVLLHFGAVDQVARVSVNGNLVGEHEGGYLPFTFDITDFAEDGENKLTVYVTDDLGDRSYPYGKQRYDRGGMWYTPVSGIWQTVWLEVVPKEYVRSLHYETSADSVTVTAEGVTDGKITVFAPTGAIEATLKDGKATVNIPSPRLWSPDDPYLYELTLKTESDEVKSYFALRTLEIKNVDGISRLCLNGEPIFMHALLDQGYFSDGIYTPATPELYENDILTARSFGFNTLRKHIKIEPELFYYYCDKHGMLVMQDMVNNGSYSFIRDTALPTVFMKRFPDFWLNPSKKVRRTFVKHMEDTVKHLYNHPSIVYYTVFNEGWGQFCSAKMYEKIKRLDPTRFIDTTSGWFKTSKSDVISEHVYFKPVKVKKPADKPIVISEFGGYSYKHPEHCANAVKTYGYSKYTDREEFENALVSLYEREIIPAIEKGLCVAVYTQLTDVEDETNGLVSYDRRYLKVTKDKMLEIAKKLTVK